MTLSAETVEPWLFDLEPGRADIARLLLLLDQGERLRFEQIRDRRDKIRFVARRGRLRQLLARHLDADPALLSFEHNRFGKPALSGVGDLAFNCSSSRHVGLCVIGRGVEIGCDVEWREGRNASAAIADRLFAPGERDALRALPPDQWLEGFFNCWTREEALLKCIGSGFGEPIDHLEVSLSPDAAPEVLSPSDRYRLWSFAPLPLLHAAVVIGSERHGIEVREPQWFAASARAV